MKDAVSILENSEMRSRALVQLRLDYDANSAGASKNQQRTDVEPLAGVACGGKNLYPLNELTVELVSAALKAAGFKPSQEYLSELNLGHVESKHEFTSRLARTFAGCRRSVMRGMGPIDKAPEAKLDDVETERVHKWRGTGSTSTAQASAMQWRASGC